MDSPVCNKPVNIVVDSLSLYTVEVSQVRKHGPFEGCGNTDDAYIFMLRANKTLKRPNENALLGLNTMAGLFWCPNHLVHLLGSFQQDNSARFVGRTVTSKEECEAVINGKIYQVRIAAVVLELG